ncbi:MAG: flagellar basal body rod protein FlgB [Planctomycetota bacterium]|jgi:flagellar basal-body rod protein FlgB
MYQTIFNKGSLPVAEQVLYFSAMRHDAIVNNIANAETPRYKAMDAPVEDFDKAMAKALRERDARRIPVFHFTGHGDIRPDTGGGTMMRYGSPERVGYFEDRGAGILRHIETNVDMDMEMSKLVKNAMRHNLAARVMAQQFSLLREAIAERVTG